jgi:hypothetical protein
VTESFKDRNWRPGTIRYVAAEITLQDPDVVRDANYTTTPGSAPVLYVCDRGAEQNYRYGNVAGLLYNVGGDLKYYLPLIEDWEITGPSTGFSDDFAESSCTVSLMNRRYTWQKRRSAADAQESAEYFVKLSQLFQDYLIQGQTLILYAVTEQFDYSVDSAHGVDFHRRQAQQIFYGQIRNVIITPERATLDVAAAEEHVRMIPDAEEPSGGTASSIISKVAYSTAPREYIGRSIPMVFSNRGSSGVITNLSRPINFPGLSSKMSGLWPCAITHYNDSTTRQLKIMADKWDAVGAAPSLTNFQIWLHHSDSGLMSHMLGSEASSTTELSSDFNQTDLAYLYIPANGYQNLSGTTNAQRAIDGKELTFATVAGATNWVNYFVPSVGPYGRIANIQTYVILDNTSVGAGAADGTVNLEWGLWDLDAGDWYLKTNNTGGKNPGQATKAELTGLTTPVIYRSSLWATGVKEWNAPDEPISQWQWEGQVRDDSPATNGIARRQLVLRVRNVEASSTAYVIACGLVVRFQPGVDVSGSGIPRRTGQGFGGYYALVDHIKRKS